MKLEEEEQELTFIDYNCPGSENILMVPHVIPSYKPSVLLLTLLLLLLLLLRNSCMQQFQNSFTILDLCLKSEIMDGFWSSRCLNDCIDLHNKIGSFLSAATTLMVGKNGANGSHI